MPVTIERSLLEASCPPTFNGAMPDVNAQISDTVMRTRVAEECIVVVVSKYRRAPKSFKEIFAQCSELRLRRSALEPSGSRCDLLGGFRNTVLNFFIAPGRRLSTLRSLLQRHSSVRTPIPTCGAVHGVARTICDQTRVKV